jgi:hypothetical protein
MHFPDKRGTSPARLTVSTLVVLAALALAGCVSTGGGNGLLGWLYGRKAAKEERIEHKQDEATKEATHAAHIEVRKTAEALTVAAAENPDSRAVQVAQRTNQNADSILSQTDPLTVKEGADAVAIVQGLLDKETAKREAAEKRQREAEKSAEDLGEEIATLRSQLVNIAEDRRREAENNLATANELRKANIWKWATTAGTLLFAALSLAYRYNLGGLQTGVGEALAHLQHKRGASDEDVQAMKAKIDALTLPGTQSAIFQTLTKVLASKQ